MNLPEKLKSRGCRLYQVDAIVNILNAFKKTIKHLILQAPTGGGKTWIFAQISKLVIEKNKRVLILTDRAELLNQAGGTLEKAGLLVNYIIAGSKKVNQDYSVFVAMSQTLKRRIKLDYWVEFLQSIDLLIIDECHKQEFNYIFLSQIFDKKHVTGFTATSCRTGKMRQLGLDYETIIETVPIKQLINQGYLVNDDYYGFESPDLSNVEYDRLKGDYKENSMFKAYNSPKTYAGAIKAYKKHVPNTKTLTFCVNIEHVIRTCIEFNQAGIKSKFLVSKVNKPKYPENNDLGKISQYNERLKVYNLFQENIHLTGKRQDILSEFRNNEFTNLVNAGILTTGYDEPGLITIIVLRATLSKSLWYQMLGRGSRPFENKTHFNILDFGDNQKRLGNYTSDQLWSLWHEESQGGGLPPIKNCGVDGKGKPINDQTGCTRPILAAYKICPFCGYVYPEKEKKEIDIDLLIFNQERKRALKVKGIKEMNFSELSEYWKLKGHKPPWLWYQLFSRGGTEEIEKFGKENKWKSSTIRKAVEYVGGIVK
jgi:superfamily II DNA or RNA helicase